ncbi:phage tail tape measure protein [Peptostreptococcus sp. D1]|uniref:phage tail tape measure protein n=1 Tax=Peptostreptococcus sp. D1 TaxID=72304 RepID=UPI0008EF8701|nr:phage tail tape measure protein [Peptostreptococcus sp. D1]SFE87771.1 phage tail tape measure protein, TP901 family, core region [Peptostreptococcus sp. D1]
MAKVIDTILRLRDQVTPTLTKVQKGMYGYTSSMMTTGKMLNRVGGNMQAVGTATLTMTAPLVAMGGAALKTGMQFDKTMSQVKAISGATGSEFQKLRDKAREVGATTSKSAMDAGNAMVFLSQAGYSVNDVLSLSKPLVQTAIAGNIEMAQASSLLADSMNSANIPVKDATKYLDMVAKTANVTNTDVAQLMEAWIGAGGSLRTANISMSETNALLGILANAGIKGSEAGTSLSRIFMNLNSTGAEAGKAMKALGINVADSSGKMRSKVDVLKELKSKTDTLTEAERNHYIQMIGGKQYANDLKIVLDGMGNSFSDLTSQINNSSGALNKMAVVMADNLQGSLEELKSAWEDTLITVSDAITPTARKWIDSLKGILEGIKGMNPEVIRFFASFTVGLTVFGAVNFVIGSFLKTMGSLLLSGSRLIRFFITLPAVAWKFLGVIGIIIAVGVLVYKNWDKISEVFAKVKKKLLEFLDATIGLDNIKAVFSDLKNTVKSFADGFKIVGKEFGKLFNDIKPHLMNILNIFLFVGANIIGAVVSIITGVALALDGVLTVIRGIVKVIVGLVTGDFDLMSKGVKDIMNGIKKIVSAYWKTIKNIFLMPIKAVIKLNKEAFGKAVDWVKNKWKSLKSLMKKVITGWVKAKTSGFASALSKVKKKWNEIKKALSKPLSGVINLFSNNRSSDGEHRTGKNRIPFDGYRAMLHKDEMVLNKSEADKYRNGATSSNSSKTTIINIPKLADVLQVREEADSEKVAKDIARYIRFAV